MDKESDLPACRQWRAGILLERLALHKCYIRCRIRAPLTPMRKGVIVLRKAIVVVLLLIAAAVFVTGCVQPQPTEETPATTPSETEPGGMAPEATMPELTSPAGLPATELPTGPTSPT